MQASTHSMCRTSPSVFTFSRTRASASSLFMQDSSNRLAAPTLVGGPRTRVGEHRLGFAEDRQGAADVHVHQRAQGHELLAHVPDQVRDGPVPPVFCPHTV